ncbi:30S ribosomal protein S3 [Candidatus Micrarchaeota archaeon CG1_02_55_22]|nr:MAG: 30S ribosomal protein S3 [Candidatus Micrarchaeota archaeon CG1_02_55_22]
MATEKKMIHTAIGNYFVTSYLEKALERAGVSSIRIQKTPVATRIELTVQRPGIVVGKRGSSITELSEKLKEFGIENPKIEVVEVEVPSLDAKLMCEKIGRFVETRGNVKQAIRIALREIMSAGAIGAEIRVAGKIVGKGGKAKTITVRAGYLKKSGDPIKLVREAKYTIFPKAGAIGITVKILPPGVKLPDKIDTRSIKQEVIEVIEVVDGEVVAVVEEKLDDLTDDAESIDAVEAKEEKPKKKRVTKPKARKKAVEEKSDAAEEKPAVAEEKAVVAEEKPAVVETTVAPKEE